MPDLFSDQELLGIIDQKPPSASVKIPRRMTDLQYLDFIRDAEQTKARKEIGVRHWVDALGGSIRGGRFGEAMETIKEIPPEKYEEVMEAMESTARAAATGDVTGHMQRSFPRAFHRGYEQLETGLQESGTRLSDVSGVEVLGTQEQRDLFHRLQGIIHQSEPTHAEGSGFFGKIPGQAMQMTPPAVGAAVGGKGLGAVGRGVGGAALGKAGTAIGVAAPFQQIIESQVRLEMQDAGLPPETVDAWAGWTASASALAEGLVPNPFKVKNPTGTRSLVNNFSRYLTNYAKTYGGELSEEVIQGAIESSAANFAAALDEQVPDLDKDYVYNRMKESLTESAGALLGMTGPGALIQARGVYKGTMQRRAVEDIINQINDAAVREQADLEEGEMVGPTVGVEEPGDPTPEIPISDVIRERIKDLDDGGTLSSEDAAALGAIYDLADEYDADPSDETELALREALTELDRMEGQPAPQPTDQPTDQPAPAPQPQAPDEPEETGDQGQAPPPRAPDDEADAPTGQPPQAPEEEDMVQAPDRDARRAELEEMSPSEVEAIWRQHNPDARVFAPMKNTMIRQIMEAEEMAEPEAMDEEEEAPPEPEVEPTVEDDPTVPPAPVEPVTEPVTEPVITEPVFPPATPQEEGILDEVLAGLEDVPSPLPPAEEPLFDLDDLENEVVSELTPDTHLPAEEEFGLEARPETPATEPVKFYRHGDTGLGWEGWSQNPDEAVPIPGTSARERIISPEKVLDLSSLADDNGMVTAESMQAVAPGVAGEILLESEDSADLETLAERLQRWDPDNIGSEAAASGFEAVTVLPPGHMEPTSILAPEDVIRTLQEGPGVTPADRVLFETAAAMAENPATSKADRADILGNIEKGRQGDPVAVQALQDRFGRMVEGVTPTKAAEKAPESPPVAPEPRTTQKPPKAPPEPKEPSGDAQKRRQADIDALIDLYTKPQSIQPDPDTIPDEPKIRVATRLVGGYILDGGRNFSDLVNEVADRAGDKLALEMAPVLKHAWEKVKEKYKPEGMSSSGPVGEILSRREVDETKTTPQPTPRGPRGGGPDVDAPGSEDVEKEPTERGEGRREERDTGPRGEPSGGELAGDTEQTGERRRPAGPRGEAGDEGVGEPTGRSPGNAELDTDVGGGDTFKEKARVRDNFAAIELVKRLVEEGRSPSASEQQVLLKFVGWGAMKNFFEDEIPKGWEKDAARMKDLLTKEEWASAKQSTQYSHFTDPKVVRAIWDVVQDLGFAGGRVMEPSMGTGLFYAAMPRELREASALSGIEKDLITSQIAQKLFPAAQVAAGRYEEQRIPDDSLDLTISNPPFSGDIKVNDRFDKELQKGDNLHNFFFSKAIKKTRPGGLVVFITSRFGMDARKSQKARQRWSNLGADMVGAIRLPGDAFQGIAGTAVVTDLIILQKREADAAPGGPDFIQVGELSSEGALHFGEGSRKAADFVRKPAKFKINEYFVERPENIIGEMAKTGTMYQGGGDNVELMGQDIPERIREIGKSFVADQEALAGTGKTTNDILTGERISDPEWPVDWVRLEGDRVFLNDDGTKVEIPTPYARHKKKSDPENPKKKIITEIVTSPAGAKRFRSILPVFEAAEKLVHAQADPRRTDEEVEALRDRLNKVYDAHLDAYGILSDGWNATFGRAAGVPIQARLLSLENYDASEKTATKAAIFTERTERPYERPTSAETVDEALAYTLAYRGWLDLEYMADLLGSDADAIVEELGPKAYYDPQSRRWVLAEHYLSGNIRRKLAEAEEAAKDVEGLERNVEALKAVLPEDKPAEKIEVQFGAVWIPRTDYMDFFEHLLGRETTISINPLNNKWSIEWHGSPIMNTRETEKYGTSSMDAQRIIERHLNGADLTIYYPAPEGMPRRPNIEATAMVRAKLEEIESAFGQWLWDDEARKNRLVRSFNDIHNSERDVDFDGSHLTFPGMSQIWQERLNPHQKAAVWRYLTTGNMLLGHVVGAGKTATMAAMAMEAKRISGSPHYTTMIVVPNHLIASGQFQKEILEIYPSAKVLAATPKMLSERGRQMLLKRMNTGNYDIVVVAQSSFTKIPMKAEFEQEFVQRQLDMLEEQIREAKRGTNRSFVKDLERQKESLESKLKSRLAKIGDDPGVNFEDLGVDALFADEAHHYKNLQVITKLGRVPGVTAEGSERGLDMWMKSIYMNQKTNERGMVFATGTPIANQIAELFTLQRYLQPSALARLGVEAFDAWVANFAQRVTQPEINPSGKGMRVHTRMAKYNNVPEIMRVFRQVADVKTYEDLEDIIVRPDFELQRVEVERNPILEELIDGFEDRIDEIKAGSIDPTEDNVIKVMGEARRAALDIRLADASYPDLANSKINAVADKVYQIWEATEEDLATQLIWSDLSTPTGDKKNPDRFKVYGDIIEKLVDRGIPRKEIEVIHDYNENTMGSLFAKVNEGRTRVLIGSTDKMGTGVNVQARLIAMHDLDAPWRPDGVTQRLGRMLRRGNRHKKVMAYRYISKGSFDSFVWDNLERKAKFIEQALTGARNVEDPGGQDDLDAAAMKAAAADDPHLSGYVDADAKVKQLEYERGGHRTEMKDMERDARFFDADSIDAQRKADEHVRLKKKYEEAKGEEFSAKIGEEEFTKPKKFHAAFDKLLNAMKDGQSETIQHEGLTIDIHRGMETEFAVVNETPVERQVPVWKSVVKFPDGEVFFEVKLSDSGTGSVQRIKNQIKQHSGNEEHWRNKHQEYKERAQRLMEKSKTPWAKDAELEKLRAERARLFALVRQADTRSAEIAKLLAEMTGRTVKVDEGGQFTYEDGKEVSQETVSRAQARYTHDRARGRDERIQEAIQKAERYTKPGQVHASMTPGLRPGKRPGMVTKPRPKPGETVSQVMKQRKPIQLPPETANPLEWMYQQVMQKFEPGAKTEVSRIAAQGLRQAMAETYRERVNTVRKIEKIGKTTRKWSKDDFIDAADKLEQGIIPEDIGSAEVVAAVEKMNNQFRDEVRGLGNGVLDEFYEHFFRHMWKHPQKAGDALLNFLNMTNMAGRAGFLKRRSIRYFKQGATPTDQMTEHGPGLGLEPVTWDFAEYLLLQFNEMYKWIETQRMVNFLKGHGQWRFVSPHQPVPAGWSTVDDYKFVQFGANKVMLREAFDANLVRQLEGIASNLGIDVTAVADEMAWNTWGEADLDKGEIRRRFGAPESVLAHEIGHFMDRLHFREEILDLGNNSKEAVRKRKEIQGEWRKLADMRWAGQDATESYKRYVRSQAEKTAVVFEAYVHLGKDRMRRQFPKMTEAFEEWASQKNHVTAEMLDVEPSLVMDTREMSVKQKGIQILGRYAVPTDTARLINNHLHPGLGKGKIHNIARSFTNSLNAVQLGLSGFHGTFIMGSATGTLLGRGLQNMVTSNPKLVTRGFAQFFGSLSLLGMAPAALALGAPGTIALALAIPGFILPGSMLLRRGSQITGSMMKDWEDMTEEDRKATTIQHVAGGRMGADNQYRVQGYKWMARLFRELTAEVGMGPGMWKRSGNLLLLGSLIPLGMSFISAFSDVLFGSIARMKLALTEAMVRDKLDHMENWDLNDPKVALEVARINDEVDNRFGMMSYDNVFWHRMARDASHLLIRAPGWNWGFMRTAGGAGKDFAVRGAWIVKMLTGRGKPLNDTIISHRMAEMTGTIVWTLALGSVINYILSGGEPPEDWWKDSLTPPWRNPDGTVRKRYDGSPDRILLPSYYRDVASWSQGEPLKTLSHKINPAISLLVETIATNEDFYGTEIVPEGATSEEAAWSLGVHILKSYLPFSFRNYMEFRKRDEDMVKNLAAASLGITSAPAYIAQTPAQKLMNEYLSSNWGGMARSKEDALKYRYRKDAIHRLRTHGELAEGQEENLRHYFDEKGIQRIFKDAALPPFRKSFKNLRRHQVEAVYMKASEEERDQVADLVVSKLLNFQSAAPADDREWLDIRYALDKHWSDIAKRSSGKTDEAMGEAIKFAFLKYGTPSRYTADVGREDYYRMTLEEKQAFDASYLRKAEDKRKLQNRVRTWLLERKDSKAFRDAVEYLRQNDGNAMNRDLGSVFPQAPTENPTATQARSEEWLKDIATAESIFLERY